MLAFAKRRQPGVGQRRSCGMSAFDPLGTFKTGLSRVHVLNGTALVVWRVRVRDLPKGFEPAKRRTILDNLPLLLLVEDEPLIRTSLADALDDGGYSLIEAENGAAAIAAIDSSKSMSGILTDIRLGSGPSGWDVARHARQRFPALAVVYMTGDSAADWTSEGVPKSVLLQKPFATAQMVTAISTLLNVVDVSPTQTNPADN